MFHIMTTLTCFNMIEAREARWRHCFGVENFLSFPHFARLFVIKSIKGTARFRKKFRMQMLLGHTSLTQALNRFLKTSFQVVVTAQRHKQDDRQIAFAPCVCIKSRDRRAPTVLFHQR